MQRPLPGVTQSLAALTVTLKALGLHLFLQALPAPADTSSLSKASSPRPAPNQDFSALEWPVGLCHALPGGSGHATLGASWVWAMAPLSPGIRQALSTGRVSVSSLRRRQPGPACARGRSAFLTDAVSQKGGTSTSLPASAWRPPGSQPL